MKKLYPFLIVLALANVSVAQNLHGFLNEKGEEVIPASFEQVGKFKGMLAPVKKGKWGFINKKGEFIIEPQFTKASDFVYDFSKVEKEGDNANPKYVHVNGRLHETNLDTFFFESGLKKVIINNKVGWTDKAGQPKIPAIYDGGTAFKKNRLALFYKNEKWGIVNADGKVIVDENFGYLPNALDVLSGKNIGPRSGFFSVCNAAKHYYIFDSTGKSNLIKEVDYIDENFTPNGFSYFEKNALYGVINTKGELVVAANLKSKPFFDTDYFYTKDEKKIYFYNYQNPTVLHHELVIPEKNNYLFFENGIGVITEFKMGKNVHSLIDVNGNKITKKYYNYIENSQNGSGMYAFVPLQNDVKIIETVSSYTPPQTTTSSLSTTPNTSSYNAPKTTTSNGIQVSTYALDIFSELGSMALYVGSNMYVVKIKGKRMGDVGSTAARAAAAVGINSNYKYQWFEGKNCITLKDQYSRNFTVICNGTVDLNN